MGTAQGGELTGGVGAPGWGVGLGCVGSCGGCVAPIHTHSQAHTCKRTGRGAWRGTQRRQVMWGRSAEQADCPAGPACRAQRSGSAGARGGCAAWAGLRGPGHVGRSNGRWPWQLALLHPAASEQPCGPRL